MKKTDKNNFDINDKLIKELFQDFIPEKAPETLKQTTMNKVFKDWSENPVVYKPIINKTNRLWIVGGFIALLAITFLIDASLLIEYWNKLNIDSSTIDFNSINKSFGNVGSTLMSLPSILYFIILGVMVLLGIDRFFSRLANI